MKSDVVEFTTERSVQELGRLLQQAMQQVRAQSVEPIQSGSGALAAFDDRADIEIVAEGGGLLGGSWVVQIYVVDMESSRGVTMVALGDSGFARAMNGAANTVSLSSSIKKRDLIAAIIR